MSSIQGLNGITVLCDRDTFNGTMDDPARLWGYTIGVRGRVHQAVGRDQRVRDGENWPQKSTKCSKSAELFLCLLCFFVAIKEF